MVAIVSTRSEDAELEEDREDVPMMKESGLGFTCIMTSRVHLESCHAGRGCSAASSCWYGFGFGMFPKGFHRIPRHLSTQPLHNPIMGSTWYGKSRKHCH